MTGNIPAETHWELSRLGKFTSSQIDDLFTPPKSKEDKAAGNLGETAKTYVKSRAAEIITGTTRQITSWALEWGNSYEPMAAAKLEIRYPGMLYLGKENPLFFPYSDFSGGSPDGVHQDRKLIFEIKCPENPVNHVEYCFIRNGEDLLEVQRGYYHQIQMNIACVAKEWDVSPMDMKAVFCSYCPIVNAPYPDFHSIVIEPDSEFQARLPKIIAKAEQYLAELVWSLNTENAPLEKVKAMGLSLEGSLIP